MDVPKWCEHDFVDYFGFSITFISQTCQMGCLQHQSCLSRAWVPHKQPEWCSRRISRNVAKVLEKVNCEYAKAALLPNGRQTGLLKSLV